MIYQTIIDCKINEEVPIKHPNDVFNLLKEYRNALKEHFFLITLRGNHKPVGLYIITIGTINRTIIHPREIFYKAIEDLSTGIIVAHNHPSGETDPSPEDIEITERLNKATDIIGIPILDHVIIGKKKYYSFSVNKKLKNDKFYDKTEGASIHEKTKSKRKRT
jgi:DNA repair protein RadC